MLRSMMKRSSCLAALLILIATTARAASTTSGYTVTDLGAGVATLSDPTGANATLTAPDGRTVYSFPRTNSSLPAIDGTDTQGVFGSFPKLTNLPLWGTGEWGPPSTEYSYSYYAGNTLQNQNGVVVTKNIFGVEGHDQYQTLVVLQKGNNGWTVPTAFANQSIGLKIGMDYMQSIQALDLNRANQLLGVASGATTIPFLLNLDSGVSINLQTLMPKLYSIVAPIALDDYGRLLVTAYSPDTKIHSLLLTPAGLSTTPIATPEPTVLATLAVAGIRLAARRRFGRAG